MSASANSLRLLKFIEKTKVLANLLEAKLALPLLYPLSTNFSRKGGDKSLESGFDREAVSKSLAQLSPVILGLIEVSKFLNLCHSLSFYGGSPLNRSFGQVQSENGERKMYRIHRIRKKNFNKERISNTKTGIGHGWEKYSSGEPIDSPNRKYIR